MTEKEELHAIVGVMLLECFPDRARDVIKSLRIMSHELESILKNQNISQSSGDEFIKNIAEALVFVSLHANVDYP